MRFTVYKRGVKDYLAVTILYNVLYIFFIILFSLDDNTHDLMIVCTILWIILDITLLTRYELLLSSIIFEKDVIKCKFIYRTRIVMRYDEIKEYGICWESAQQFVYISRMELSDFQRKERLWELYRKTRDVIVFRYTEEAQKYLAENP